jgi:ribosomal-protein-alanine N-acetyltransferase
MRASVVPISVPSRGSMKPIDLSVFPRLETTRFSLRSLLNSDEAQIFQLRSSDEINLYLDREKALSIEDARDFIQKIEEGTSTNKSFFWVIAEKASGNFCGTICLWNISIEEESADIGFELLPDHQGKGIMQEVIPLVLDYGFKQIGFRSIHAELSPRNIKSLKLLKKNGFRFKEENHVDSVIYTLDCT